MVGPHVTDLIEAGTVALDAEATVETVADGMAAHPTLSEGIKEAGPAGARTRDSHAESQARRHQRVAVSENGRSPFEQHGGLPRDRAAISGRSLRQLRSSSARSDRAFEQLYKRHAREVYQYALALLANPADAEDVTQTTFLNAYRAFQKGERPHKPHNWLITIAHNVCRMRWRQAGSRPREVALDEAPEPAARDDEQPRRRRGPDRARRAFVQPAGRDRDARARGPQLPRDLRRARCLGERGGGAALPRSAQPEAQAWRARRAHDRPAARLARLVHRRRGRSRRGWRRGFRCRPGAQGRRSRGRGRRNRGRRVQERSGDDGSAQASSRAGRLPQRSCEAAPGGGPDRGTNASGGAGDCGPPADDAQARRCRAGRGPRLAPDQRRVRLAAGIPDDNGSATAAGRDFAARCSAASSAAAPAAAPREHPAAAAAAATTASAATTRRFRRSRHRLRSRRPRPFRRRRCSSNPSAGCKIRRIAASFR